METPRNGNFEHKLDALLASVLPVASEPPPGRHDRLRRAEADVRFGTPVQSKPRQPVEPRSKPKSAEIKLANRLRQLRQDKQLTLKDLATAAGMSQAYLSRVENHKVSLTIAGLEQLAE